MENIVSETQKQVLAKYLCSSIDSDIVVALIKEINYLHYLNYLSWVHNSKNDNYKPVYGPYRQKKKIADILKTAAKLKSQLNELDCQQRSLNQSYYKKYKDHTSSYPHHAHENWTDHIFIEFKNDVGFEHLSALVDSLEEIRDSVYTKDQRNVKQGNLLSWFFSVFKENNFNPESIDLEIFFLHILEILGREKEMA
jgi:hypothetical protein